MNYARPILRERLAADYVLGLMPRRTRQRFERAMTASATLAAIAAAWSDRLAPLDTLSEDETPPAHVWRAIERRVGPGARGKTPGRSLPFFWRGLTAAAAAACAAIVIYAALNPLPLPTMATTLAERVGMSGWVAAAKRAPADVGLSTIRLGVPERERPRWLRAALLLTSDALPLTTEPPAQSR